MSDSIKKLIKIENEKTQKVEHYYSKPIILSETKLLIFQHITVLPSVGSDNVFFYGKDSSGNWRIIDKYDYGNYRFLPKHVSDYFKESK